MKSPIEVVKDLYPKLPAIKEHAESVGTKRNREALNSELASIKREFRQVFR